ncbi:MAG: radical SAM protein [candidate division WOR-3 bacterium]
MTRKEKLVINSIKIFDKFIHFLPGNILAKLIIEIISPLLRKVCMNREHTISQGVGEDIFYMTKAMLYTILRIELSDTSRDIFVNALFYRDKWHNTSREWREKYGEGPPGFLVISPTKACNLRCYGCYANAAKETDKLPKEVFERIIREAMELWGVRFFVISGGEPLMYKDKGEDLLTILNKFRDAIFLFYTNGLLIDEERAKRMAEMGNVTPAISVEGFRETTDKRRGEGSFDKILAVMERLRRNRVLFGISLTATRYNCEEILSDEFIDFFFFKMGAAYGWLFHYMPIGRDADPSLMPTPKQRVWMWQRSWEIVRKKKIMLADFWNHGTVSYGCIAGGREGGYFHINWHGDCAPCVFFPYAVSNIIDIYNQGGTINDVLFTPFFKAIRDWQKGYGFLSGGKVSGDWLRPCPIRDHFLTAKKMIEEYGARPIDYAPNEIDKKYIEEMVNYDKNLEKLTLSIWQNKYLNNR